MRVVKLALVFLATVVVCVQAFAQPIKVCINTRGTTGIESRVRETLEREFTSFEQVSVTDDNEECHLYLDVAIVEQDPIRFYGMGISISYHIRDQFYGRPTADVAQFGAERMEEVCAYLAKEIDKAFLQPLRRP